MRSALLCPGSISTSCADFGESTRMPADNSLQAPKVEGEIHARRNPREHLGMGYFRQAYFWIVPGCRPSGSFDRSLIAALTS
jgi:hypothetical protein